MSVRPSNPAFETLLGYLRVHRGFDFTAYKRNSLMRRVNRRMQMLGIEDYTAYVDHLEVHPGEFNSLFNMILINVTGFFRDPPVWEHIAEKVLPPLLENTRQDSLRVWSAGCASGQEAYTLAMLLAEAIGAEAFRHRVKIYGTDADEEALAQARQASYSAREVETVPPALRERYFEAVDDRFVFHKDLRRSVVFGRHDLLQDAPISRVDLLTCRNTLMYFNAENQGRILSRFHFALKDTGILLLGKAETLLTHSRGFVPVELRQRVFAKANRNDTRERMLLAIPPGRVPPTDAANSFHALRNAASQSASAQVVMDLQGMVTLVNQKARLLFGLTGGEIGQPFRDLELAYRPEDLRSRIEQVLAERRPLLLSEVEWVTTPGPARYLDIELLPLMDTAGEMLGVSIRFDDVTSRRRIGEELRLANQKLETALEEVQSTNEELETTNEELQSTVEELETTNEELQSTNEEMETINDELRLRGDELNEMNAFLSSILSSMRGGVVVLDRNLQIMAWNPRSEDLWGLRSDEVRGKNFLNLDVGLPVERLKPAIRACLAGETEFNETLLDAINRRGKPISCRVTCTFLHDAGGAGDGVILVIEEQ